MKAYTIDTENNITVFATLKEIEASGGTETFTSPEELSALAAHWPGVRLVEIWNGLPGVEPVQRFTSRRVAVNRIWKAIQHLIPSGAAQARTAPVKGVGRKQTPSRVPPRPTTETKTAQIIALLRKPKGATRLAIIRATC
jgi:hypothetical protein